MKTKWTNINRSSSGKFQTTQGWWPVIVSKETVKKLFTDLAPSPQTVTRNICDQLNRLLQITSGHSPWDSPRDVPTASSVIHCQISFRNATPRRRQGTRRAADFCLGIKTSSRRPPRYLESNASRSMQQKKMLATTLSVYLKIYANANTEQITHNHYLVNKGSSSPISIELVAYIIAGRPGIG